MRLMGALAASAALIALPGMAVAAPRGVWATDAVVHPAPAHGPPTAAYLTLHNDGGRPVTLTGVTCDCAGMVMAHRSSERDGMAHMAAAGAVVVPPHGEVVFAPGGLHLMLMDLDRPIRLGETVAMRLTFEGARPLTVAFPARR